jgi:phenylacetate-coenzyme A ligase PaaK-like adenylate-forming protein
VRPEIDAKSRELPASLALDPDARQSFQFKRFRLQAARACQQTAYYGVLFADLGYNPQALKELSIDQVPLTQKEAVLANPDAFVSGTARPVFRTATTGTTGRPTSISFSAYEMATYIALTALADGRSGEVTSEDIVQLSTSSRAGSVRNQTTGWRERNRWVILL